MTTSFDQAALDGVYKLSALRDEKGVWQYKLKLSEQSSKISNPGIYQVRRYTKHGNLVKDVMYDVELGLSGDLTDSHDVLVPVFRQGKFVQQEESIHVLRERAIQQVMNFVKQHPKQSYPVELEQRLHDLKQRLILQARDNEK